MESRPMANPPQGAPQKSGAKATKKKGGTKKSNTAALASVVPEVEASAVPEGEVLQERKRPRRQPRKTAVQPDAVNPDVPIMTAEAREESVHIHRVEREQREVRAEML
jgi:hypothetical protein